MSSASAPARAASILIVEDERLVAVDIQETLRELGYDAFAVASSGDEALARASERCPDLVLMDIRIKGPRDGIETARLLNDEFGVPIVYLTAHADAATLERAKGTAPHGYLVKPVNSAELRSTIEVALHRAQLDRRLRERERWLSTTVHSMADAVVAVDFKGAVTFMNAAAEQLLGVPAADAIGRPAREALPSFESGRGGAALEVALEEGRAAGSGEAPLVSTGGGRIVSEEASPVIDAGRVLGAVMQFRDVTEQKLLQKRLELAERLACLGTLAAGVAHEINNPLAVVAGNAALTKEDLGLVRSELEEGAGPSEHSLRRLRDAELALSEIESATARIASIVRDLKGFSRPAGQGGPSRVERAIEWAIRATQHEIRQRARLVSQLSPVPAVALDETRLGQVLVNLLTNAAHSIEPGHVERNEITLRVTEAAGHVLIEVRDTGSGMSAEVLSRMFEPFFTTKPVGAGTGLGLSISQGIVRSAGGAISVESRVGEGSTFRVELPAVTPEASSPAPAPTSGVSPRKARLLVIDDEEPVRRLLGRLMAEHDVATADSPARALELLDDGQTFDLIFCDLIMPKMTGMEFYEHLLRRSSELAHRVIFMTGGTVTAAAADFLSAVPNPQLQKPFDFKALKVLVQQLLARSGLAAAAVAGECS